MFTSDWTVINKNTWVDGEKLRIFIPTVRELNISDRSLFQEDKNTNVAAAQTGKTQRGERDSIQRLAEFWLKSVAFNLCSSFDILTSLSSNKPGTVFIITPSKCEIQ